MIILGKVFSFPEVLLSVYSGVAQQKVMQGGGKAGQVSFLAQVTAQQVRATTARWIFRALQF